MQFNCLNTHCFPLAQPYSPLLLHNVVLRQRTRVWPLLSAPLCPGAEGLKRSSFQQRSARWGLRTTSWISSCSAWPARSHLTSTSLQSCCVAWAKPKLGKKSNPTKSEGKWAVVHLCFCKLRMALCNTTSCHAPELDMSSLDAVLGLHGKVLVAGRAIGVASVRSCQKLPPCLIKPVC